MKYSESLEEINIIIYILELFCISLGTYYAVIKNTNTSKNKNITSVLTLFAISILCEFVKYKSNFMNTMLCLIILLSVTFARTDKDNIGYYILTTTICLSLNYIIFLIAVAISYFPNYIMNIRNNYISFI